MLDLISKYSGNEELYDLRLEDSQDGNSLLHIAAKTGNLEAFKTLLREAKIPWNIVNTKGISVGEVAKLNGHEDVYEFLVHEGVRTEIMLTIMGERVVEDGTHIMSNEPGVLPPNSEYLQRHLIFSEGRLLDSDGNAVMMGWEEPLMKLHAAVICPKEGLHILNIGFGLGIFDQLIQDRQPASHTIIEAHPDVYKHMIDNGWDSKPGVRIIHARWQDALPKLNQIYDGIFFDTFGEYIDDMKQFHEHLPNILSDENGIYSFFNGLCGTNPFFHDVSCQIVELDLLEMGLRTSFEDVDVETLGDDVWRNVKRAYWSLPVYRLPTVVFE